ncbi:MAG: hypothetical protein ABJA20_00565 [Novosphingobium sp.]
MMGPLIGSARQAMMLSVVGGFVLLGAAATLLPDSTDLAAASRRAAAAFAGPVQHAPPPATPVRPPELLASLFEQGTPLRTWELQRLLAYSTKQADAKTLTAIVRQIEVHEPVPSARVTWDILASHRPAVAQDFLEQRADKASPANWPLRFELHRQTGDLAFARGLVRAAATTPGLVKPPELIASAYAVDFPEGIVIAAEHRAIPALDRPLSLDMARRAAAQKRFDLIARIDRSGTAAWRNDDPWLAMDLARRSGDFATALRYATMLPTGRDEARRSLIIASGDRQAIRTMLLDQARSNVGEGRAAIAQQLLDTGFRPDAIALLQADCANRAPADPVATRLLFLMGPRPDKTGLQWLHAKAVQSGDWQQVYIDRAKPAEALAFMSRQPGAATTKLLLQRLRMASAAHDRQTGLGLIAQLLDGRPLSAAEASAMSANAPARLDNRLALALSRARIAANIGLPQDRLDLAWDGWNRGRPDEAYQFLDPYLKAFPKDRAALRLMANVEKKRRGDGAARVWLERALDSAPSPSLDRAEILERLGRAKEAILIVEALRQTAPGDNHLKAVYGRLLIASGNPGRAQKVLQP